MNNKRNILIAAGIVIVVLAGLLAWYLLGGSFQNGSPAASQQAAAPTIPQVPPTAVGYSARLTSGKLIITVPGKATTTVITSAEITTVHHDALAAAIKQMQAAAASSAPAAASSGSSSSSALSASAPSSPASVSAAAGQVAPASISDYLASLAKTMGFEPLSTSYTVLFGKDKVYFAAKGMPTSGAQGKISVFSYDTTSGLVQVAVLPDVGLQQVSDVALSPDERYLVLFQCNTAPNNSGCYRLSYGFFVFDLPAQKEVGYVAGAVVPSPQSLYSFGQWFNDSSFSYNIYQPTNASGTAVIQLGAASYEPSGNQTYNIP
jgi:WD40 repeat protein